MPVHGVMVGQTMITATAPGSTPGSATIRVVDGPINIGSVSIGRNLQAATSGSTTPAAPAGNLAVTLTSSDPTRVVLSNSPTMLGTGSIMVTVPAGSTSIPTFYVQALADAGVVPITATAPGRAPRNFTATLGPSGFYFFTGNFGTQPLAADFNVQLRAARLNATTLAVVADQPVRGGLGQVAIGLGNSNTSAGTLVVNPVTFDANVFTANSAYRPLATGQSMLSMATPMGFSTPSQFQSITATVTSEFVSFSQSVYVIGQNLQVSTSVALSRPAPAGNLAVTVSSADPSRVLLSNTATGAGAASIMVTVAAGTQNSPTFYIQNIGTTSGTVGLMATGAPFAAGSANVQLAPGGFYFYTGNFSTTRFSNNSTIQLRASRLDPNTLAPSVDQAIRGGVSPVGVTINNNNTTAGVVVTNPVPFAANASSASTEYNPNAVGISILTIVTPAGFTGASQYQQISVNVANAVINIANTTIGRDLQTQLSGSLGAPAPAGNEMVTISSADPGRVLVAPNSTALGSPSIGLVVPAGSTTLPTFYVHALDRTGNVQLVATAPDFAPSYSTVTLVPSGFYLYTGSFTTSTFAANSSVQLRSARLDPNTLGFSVDMTLRGGIAPVGVNVTSSNIAVGNMVGVPASFAANTYIANVGFDPSTAGMTNLNVVSPSGWDTPAQYQQITATVTAPDIFAPTINVGKDLQVSQSITTAASPPNPVDFTVSVGDPGIAVVSKSATTNGATSVTFANVATNTVGTLYVQGVTVGSTSLTISAPGYNDKTVTVNVRPSGFYFYTSNFTTQHLAPNANVQFRAAMLDPNTFNVAADQYVRPAAAPVSFSINTNNAPVGSIPTGPTFASNTYVTSAEFDAASPGMVTLTINTPAGWSTPSNSQSIVVTVNQSSFNVPNATVGEDLQASLSLSFMHAPPAAIDVTVTVGDSSKALIATSATVAGVGSITFQNVNGTNIGTVYVQGLQVGTTTLNVSAPGYAPAMSTITIRPSGFYFYTTGFSTNTFATPTNVQIRAAYLNATTLNFDGDQSLRAGITPVTVTLNSSDTNVGMISSPTFNGNQYLQNAAFTPANSGMTTLSITTPANWHTPSNDQSIVVNVTAPDIFASNTSVGRDLQLGQSISCAAAPPGATTFTVTSNDPSIVRVSNAATTVGTTSTTFPSVTGTSIGTLQIHGIANGTGTVTISATGYNPKTITITVKPSGFYVYAPGNFSTTTLSPATNIQIRSAMLDSIFLNTSADQQVRAGIAASVPIMSSSPPSGTITNSPLTFTGNTSSMNGSFHPGSTAGMTTLTVQAPAGFDTPSNSQSITATVSLPAINLADQQIGEDLQVTIPVTLQFQPSAPVDVTATSSDAAIARVSTSATTAGTGMVTFSNVSTTAVGNLTISGISRANTTVMLAATGYSPRTANVSVHPSGFHIASPSSITTTTSSGNTNIQIRPARLDPLSLNVAAVQALRAGLAGNVLVTVLSSNTMVGTITVSPVSFGANVDSVLTAFDPAAVGSAIITVQTPGGFDTPFNLQNITATVNP